MKQILKWFVLALSVISLAACSALSGVTEAVQYPKQALDYVQQTSSFINEVQTIAETGDISEENQKALLDAMKKQKEALNQFNELTPPSIQAAEDIHNQIVDFNGVLEPVLDESIAALESGSLQPDALKQAFSPVFDGIGEVTNLVDGLNNLLKQ